MLEKQKYWNNLSKYEYNIAERTVSCWILGEHGNRERVSNGEANLIKAQYTGLKCQDKTPLDYQYTVFKNEGQGGKAGLFLQWEEAGHK
jgi:hypothetical protein